MAASIATSPGTSDDRGPGFPRFIDTAAAFEKPLLAAVNGLGVGIGLTVLLHCDVAFIAASARLARAVRAARCRPRSRRQPPDARRSWATSAPRLALYTGDWITADEAVECGLAIAAVPEPRCCPRHAGARHAASPRSRWARSWSTKRVVIAGRIDAIRAARAREDAAFAAMIGAPANVEALTAFLGSADPGLPVARHAVTSRLMTIAQTRSGKVEGIEQRRRARVQGHPVRGAAGRPAPLAAARSGRKRGTACATRRGSRPIARRPSLAMQTHASERRRARRERRQPVPQRVDARVRRRAPAGDGVDPRRRVHLRFGRHAVVRRRRVREARRRRRRHPQLPPRRVRLPAPRRPLRRRRSQVPATRASSTRSPRSSGCATTSPGSAATPTT